MKITVFSDVHGNLPALEKMIGREPDSDKYVFLGDAVNYGPWSNECVDLISTLQNSILIKGNHEVYFLDGEYPGTNPIAKSFFTFCYPLFNRFSSIELYLHHWEYNNFFFKHTIENKNVYPDTLLNLNHNYFIGHSHHQFCTNNNGYILYNTGSIGQNRKYIDVINYINWYPDEQKVEYVNLLYNVDILLAEMKNKNYPKECINYYLAKQRCSMA